MDGSVSQIDIATGETVDVFSVSPRGTRVFLTMTPEGLMITAADGNPITTLPTSAVR